MVGCASVYGVEALKTLVGHLLFAVPVSDQLFTDFFVQLNRVLRLGFLTEFIVAGAFLVFEFLTRALSAAGDRDDGEQERGGVEVMSHDADFAVSRWTMA